MKKYFTQKESAAIGFIAIAFIVGEGVNFYREGSERATGKISSIT